MNNKNYGNKSIYFQNKKIIEIKIEDQEYINWQISQYILNKIDDFDEKYEEEIEKGVEHYLDEAYDPYEIDDCVREKAYDKTCQEIFNWQERDGGEIEIEYSFVVLDKVKEKIIFILK